MTLAPVVPYEAQRLPVLPDTPALNEALQALAVGCQGMIYSGERLESLVMAVRLLRARPDLAQALGIAPTPDPDLVQRCREIQGWRSSGILKGDALRAKADQLPELLKGELHLAEDATYREAITWLLQQVPPVPQPDPASPQISRQARPRRG